MAEKINVTHQDTLRGSLSEHRKWWDVTHYSLHVQPDIDKFSIRGICTISFRVTDQTSGLMQIDLQQPLNIHQVLLNQKKVRFYQDQNVWYVCLPGGWGKRSNRKIKTNTQRIIHQLEIHYSGVPKPAIQPPWDGGIVWKKDKKGNPWIGTACQGLGASAWWPCKDHQSDKPDSATIQVTIPDTLMNISNGKLSAIQTHPDRKQTWIWKVSNPINTYNITMNIGKYTHWTDSLLGEKGWLPLSFYVLEYEKEKAQKQFVQTKPMIKAFENWFGPYPFYEDGYKLVQTPYLGMEHQSAIAYGNDFENGYKGRDLSKTGQGLKWDFILIHESGHEWFGNNITSEDVADMWIHEGFTNYSECLYMHDVFDRSAANEYIQGLRKNVLNDKPVIGPYGVNKEGSADMYYKASNMIHTIRQLVDNDSLFRKMLRNMNQQYYHATVTTQEIEAFIIRETGKPLQKIFDQYLRTTKIPVLEYHCAGDKKGTECLVRWQNTVDDFDMPLKIPVSSQEFRWIKPSNMWQTISGIELSPEAFQTRLDTNFYIEYKQRKP